MSKVKEIEDVINGHMPLSSEKWMLYFLTQITLMLARVVDILEGEANE